MHFCRFLLTLTASTIILLETLLKTFSVMSKNSRITTRLIKEYKKIDFFKARGGKISKLDAFSSLKRILLAILAELQRFKRKGNFTEISLEK
jgi:hypothetical protein